MSDIEHNDPVNARILAISERSGVPLDMVLERIRLMLDAGTIRRVRQTLIATNLAHGALVAWKISENRLTDAFDFMFREDPFSGHVVVRSTDAATAGSEYRLWTTLKVPEGSSLQEHGEILAKRVGAEGFRLMPAKGIFSLGVGHVRRKTLEPGDKAEVPATMIKTGVVQLDPEEWDVLIAMKREFEPGEIRMNPWAGRAAEAGVTLERFFEVAEGLVEKKVMGRFSTFLEHVKPSGTGVRVTRFNGLFHWAVPAGREIEAGSEVGRHHVLTHCYWREGGPDFRNVNIMAVAHGGEKDRVLEHKAAIDRHLESCGIPVTYTNVFWGGRSEIKPSEISPVVHREWTEKMAGAVAAQAE
jgi:hypothetical protein